MLNGPLAVKAQMVVLYYIVMMSFDLYKFLKKFHFSVNISKFVNLGNVAKSVTSIYPIFSGNNLHMLLLKIVPQIFDIDLTF